MSWDKLEQISLGRMGMNCDEFYDLTPRSFSNKLLGFNSYQERIMQDNWEQTRLIVHSTLSPHIKKEYHLKNYSLSLGIINENERLKWLQENT